MMRLNADGTITIEFDQPDKPEPLIVTLRRPSFGTFKRLRVEANKILTENEAFSTETREKYAAMRTAIEGDESLHDDEKNAQVAAREAEMVEAINTRTEDSTIAWWSLVLVGDDTLKRLADVEVPAPEFWPAYLAYGAETREVNGVMMKFGSSRIAINHWQSVPLDRGGRQP